MNDAVGIGIDELPKAVRGVVGSHEPTFYARRLPLGVQDVRIRDIEVHDASRTARFVRVVWLEVELHRPPFGEAILRWLVEFSRKAQPSVSGESSVDIVHGDDGSDAFEDHLGHDKTR